MDARWFVLLSIAVIMEVICFHLFILFSSYNEYFVQSVAEEDKFLHENGKSFSRKHIFVRQKQV